MKKFFSPFIIIVTAIMLLTVSCSRKEKKLQKEIKASLATPIDSNLVKDFFVKHPQLQKYQPEVLKLYRKHQYHYVWYDKDGINDFANLLYSKLNNLEKDGVEVDVPYKSKLAAVYDDPENEQKPDFETELLSSSLYFFYADKVYKGMASKYAKDLGWYLPRKRLSYVNYLDSLLVEPNLAHKDEEVVLDQYYRLKGALQKYRGIEKKGGWKTITMDPNFKSLKPGDNSKTIAQIRQRLFITGEIDQDNKSTVYDSALATAVLRYKTVNGITSDKTILPEHIKVMNIPVSERIKTIVVNMERCRWVPSDITDSPEYIMVNIPAYQLTFMRNQKPELVSRVVVGKALNKTVIFSAVMKYIAFSPYWNVPPSILQKEILPAIEENENYLAEHNMEWNGESVRQKPGGDNALGKVKFMFPNSNNIYLHDTPSKSLFNKEDRAFSHGCIRVEKPEQLANVILKNDPNWSSSKIHAAMNSDTETSYSLKNRIPVYIGYFTSWVDDSGNVYFYEDIYHRDARLASLIYAD